MGVSELLVVHVKAVLFTSIVLFIIIIEGTCSIVVDLIRGSLFWFIFLSRSGFNSASLLKIIQVTIEA